MAYPELMGTPENRQVGSNTNDEQQVYQPGEQISNWAEEPPNWDETAKLKNELLSLYKNNDAFLKSEFNKMNKTLLILAQELAVYRKQNNPEPDSAD